MCKCRSGYRLAQDGTTCNDIDECLEYHPCSQKCTNTIGSFTCSCLNGFALSDTNTCLDVDECQQNPCKITEVCLNTYGSYYCLAVDLPPTRPPVTAPPLPFLNCDFEMPCSWNQLDRLTLFGELVVSDNVDWIRKTGDTPSEGTGPQGDHTMRLNGAGHYMYLEASSPATVGSTALYISPVITSAPEMCISFAYHMYGIAMGELSLMQMYKDQSVPVRSQELWKLQGDKGEGWKTAKVTIPSHSQYYLAFKAIRGQSVESDIAIDDIVLENPNGPCDDDGRLRVLDCDFEGPCNTWLQLSSAMLYGKAYADQMDWIRKSGGTPTSNSGPIGDHTTGNGHYMYLEASGAQQGDIAVIHTDIIQPVSEKCLSFAYHMYGRNIGSLELDLVYEEAPGSVKELALWSAIGNKGNQWLVADVTVPMYNSYYLMFKAVRGNGVGADIAIDDVKIVKEGPCSVPSGLNLDCNFDQENSCPWKQVEGANGEAEGTMNMYGEQLADQYNWLRLSGKTATSGSGPDGDHTTGNGFYMYMEASDPVPEGSKVMLVTPVIKTSRDICLTFSYHMFGRSIGSLEVKQIHPESGGPISSLWIKQGNQDNQWYTASVTVPYHSEYYLVLEAIRGRDYQGDVAIDDIMVDANGPCLGMMPETGGLTQAKPKSTMLTAPAAFALFAGLALMTLVVAALVVVAVRKTRRLKVVLDATTAGDLEQS